jgi:uncharacterized membrane protein
MLLFLTGLIIFFALHSLPMARSLRQSALDRLGAGLYRVLFSALSLLGFALMVSGYADAPRLVIWEPPAVMRFATLVLMLPVFVLLLATYLPGHIKAKTRNPTLLALKTWALAHLLVNGDLPSMLLFGAFLAWGVIDLINVKRSGRAAQVPQPRGGFDVAAVAGGLTLYALFVIDLHARLIGVALLP